MWRSPARFLLIVVAILFYNHCGFAATNPDPVDSWVRKMMKDGNLPGLSITIVSGDSTTFKSYGYAGSAAGQAVTPNTLFQLGSCSKAFTGLAVWQLIGQKKIDPEADVTKYLPWLKLYYKQQPGRVKVSHLLHHTSGIPWSTIFSIPVTNADDALLQTIQALNGQELVHRPGRVYEYSTINYDILALIISTVTGQSFEDYMQQHVFGEAGLMHTTMGIPYSHELMAAGHKVSFFAARPYQAPVYKGNNAAGYVITDARDMGRWLQLQLGIIASPVTPEIMLSHQRDESVPPHDMAFYATGWEASLSGGGEIYHSGLNPDYSAYVILNPSHKLGIAVMTNVNSALPQVIGNRIMKQLLGESRLNTAPEENPMDKMFSVGTIIAVIYSLIVISFIVLLFYEVKTGRRKYVKPAKGHVRSFLLSILYGIPFIYAIYISPGALSGLTWSAALVWAPFSFPVLMIVLCAGIFMSYCAGILNMLFPHEQPFRNALPGLALVSILTGVANMLLMLLITSSLREIIQFRYLIFFYALTLSLYILGRRYVQVNLIRFSRNAVYELRVKLIDRIFRTSYQRFEKMDRGKVYVSLNDDVGVIGDSSGMFVTLITSVFTALCAFIYLSTLAFWATMLTLMIVGVLLGIYMLVSGKTHRYLKEARDTRNVFMRLTNVMVDGFKELSLHVRKKTEYQQEISNVVDEYRRKITIANIRFAYASILGETLVVLLLAAVAFLFPRLFPEIQDKVIMNYIIILLFLLGPVNVILSAIPPLLQFKIALSRVRQFLTEIPANIEVSEAVPDIPAMVNKISVKDLVFHYRDEKAQSSFSIGPVNLEIHQGELLFIIGGNGSGKTTFTKLLTGLYQPDEGSVRIDNKDLPAHQLGEYFSAVFNPNQLFEKIYGLKEGAYNSQIADYLETLGLSDKVSVADNKYSTIDLSGGQRKRLGLLQCYLESRPIYLFDEWAADQDPVYRRFFYRTLLPEMKKMGKIVIVITHDDHYFDVADRVMKMDNGKLHKWVNENSNKFSGV